MSIGGSLGLIVSRWELFDLDHKDLSTERVDLKP